MPRADVRRVLAGRKVTKTAVLTGAATGAVILGLLIIAGPGWDLSFYGKALFAGAGAGRGALGGSAVGATARAKLICESLRKVNAIGRYSAIRAKT